MRANNVLNIFFDPGHRICSMARYWYTMRPGGTGPGCSGGVRGGKGGGAAVPRGDVSATHLGAGALENGLAVGAALGDGDGHALRLGVELQHLWDKEES